MDVVAVTLDSEGQKFTHHDLITIQHQVAVLLHQRDSPSINVSVVDVIIEPKSGISMFHVFNSQ